MLAFASVYFSESGLFKGLRPIQIKKSGARLSLRTRRLRRVRLSANLRRTRPVRALPLGLARLAGGKRRGHDLADAEVGRHAVELVQYLLARVVVILLVGAGCRLVTVEPVERLEIRADRRNIACRDRLGPELHRGRQAVQLQLRMLGAAVDLAFP